MKPESEEESMLGDITENIGWDPIGEEGSTLSGFPASLIAMMGAGEDSGMNVFTSVFDLQEVLASAAGMEPVESFPLGETPVDGDDSSLLLAWQLLMLQ